MVELNKPSCQAKNTRTEAVLHLNNALNVPLHLIENCTFKYALIGALLRHQTRRIGGDSTNRLLDVWETLLSFSKYFCPILFHKI